jgi:succinate-semialdehyde dehydrogenase/glutarate-semialdehyde dehydrogenase
VASKRFIVLAEVYDGFVAGMRDRFAALRPGDPADPATTFGPLSSEQAAHTLIEQVEDAVGKGATVVIGGGLSDLGMQELVNHKLVCAVPPDAPLRGFGGS